MCQQGRLGGLHVQIARYERAILFGLDRNFDAPSAGGIQIDLRGVEQFVGGLIVSRRSADGGDGAGVALGEMKADVGVENGRLIGGVLHHDAEIGAPGTHGGRSTEEGDIEDAGLALELNLAAVALGETSEQEKQGYDLELQCIIPRICMGWKKIQMPVANSAQAMVAQGRKGLKVDLAIRQAV